MECGDEAAGGLAVCQKRGFDGKDPVQRRRDPAGGQRAWEVLKSGIAASCAEQFAGRLSAPPFTTSQRQDRGIRLVCVPGAGATKAVVVSWECDETGTTVLPAILVCWGTGRLLMERADAGLKVPRRKGV